MIEKISKKIFTSPKLIVCMSTVVLIFCIASGFLLSNLLFHREPEEIAAKKCFLHLVPVKKINFLKEIL